MNDPSQVLFNWATAGVSVLLGWALKFVYDKLIELQKADLALADKVQNIEVLVAGQYIKRTDMEKMYDAVLVKLDRIEAKLDGKADKNHSF